MATDEPSSPDTMDDEPSARWADWWMVGCGVESLHHLLTATPGPGDRPGVAAPRDSSGPPNLDDVLREALGLDGYDERLGWRHHALVEVARRRGRQGEVRGSVSPTDLMQDACAKGWLVSVNAPEQFASTHLVAVRRTDAGLSVFWPQAHPFLGERFVVDSAWFAPPRMTGRGIRFT